MSGDVQPRKRKEKKRRRDEDEGSSSSGVGVSLMRSSSQEQAESVQIHIYKEAGTGGHWCARIVFFTLLAALLGVVGLIIIEHRGISNVDTPESSSKFAAIFEGWVEVPTVREDKEEADSTIADLEQAKNSDEYEHEYDYGKESESHNNSEEDIEGHDKKFEENDENEYYGNINENNDETDRDEVLVDLESFNEAVDTSECSQEDEAAYDEEERLVHTTFSEEQNQNEAEQDFRADNDDNNSAERQFDHAPNNKETDDLNNENNEHYLEEQFYNIKLDDDLGALEEIEGEDEKYEKSDNEISEIFNGDLDFSIEGIKSADDNELNNFDENVAKKIFDASKVNEIDNNSAEPLDEVDEEEIEKIIEELLSEEEQIKGNLDEEPTNVVMKFGVGVALIVTAHFVLIRRWNNDEDNAEIFKDDNEVPDLLRRNTLVSSVHANKINTINEIDRKILNKDQELMYEELRSTYNKVGSKKKRSGIDEIFSKKAADLEMMLHGTKESQNNSKDKHENDFEDFENSENDQDYEDEEEYEDEDVEDIENEEEKKIENLKNVENHYMVKKCGKLLTSPYNNDKYENQHDYKVKTEEEEEEEETEEEEKEEDEEEN